MKFNKSATQEEKVEYYKSVLRTYIDKVRKKDVDGICALYAEDAVIEDPIGLESGIRKGAAEIREFYEGVVQQALLEIVEPVRGSFSASAAMAVRAKLPGFVVEAISVVDFDDDGLIRKYRVYWGPTDKHPV